MIYQIYLAGEGKKFEEVMLTHSTTRLYQDKQFIPQFVLKETKEKETKLPKMYLNWENLSDCNMSEELAVAIKKSC